MPANSGKDFLFVFYTMKYLIFDFDGVLGDTDGPRAEIIKEMEGKTDAQIATEKDKYFTKSPHTRGANLSQKQLAEIKEWTATYGNLLHQRGFNLFGGFIEEIKKIGNKKIAVVSSGSSAYIKPKLENCGLEFFRVLTFEDHHSKEEKVEIICAEWGIPMKVAYFFTDTISDVKELENIMDRDKIYGCAWGYHGAQKLSAVLDTNHILLEFSDIQEIFPE